VTVWVCEMCGAPTKKPMVRCPAHLQKGHQDSDDEIGPQNFMGDLTTARRLVYQHTRGPWKGIRQIVGLVTDKAFLYVTCAEARPHRGPVPEKLKAVPMSPDGRMGKGAALKTTDKYVLYLEVEP